MASSNSWRRQQNTSQEALPQQDVVNPRGAVGQGPSLETARTKGEAPSAEIGLLEKMLERNNMLLALKRVKENKGSPGIDGMSVTGLNVHLKENWLQIKDQLLRGTSPSQSGGWKSPNPEAV